MKKHLFFFGILFICCACVGQQKGSNSLLWRINKTGVDSSSYLFGTIHLPQKKFLVYSDSVYEAIQNSRLFYNEIDFMNTSVFTDPGLIEFFTAKGRYLDSIKHTGPWKNLISRINRRYNVNIAPDNLDEFVQFGQKVLGSYFGPEEGVSAPDIMLAQHAIILGKETGGLETHLLQFTMLYDVIDARMSDTTLDFQDETNLLVSMKKFYLEENIDSISAIVENMNATYREIVFDKRNKTMADSIEKHSINEPSFFAIGAGHLGGKNGVIEMLRKKGFTLTPVYSNNKMSILVVNNMIKMSFENKEKLEAKYDGDVKIDLLPENPPPPPPKESPPKVKMEPVKPKKKNN